MEQGLQLKAAHRADGQMGGVSQFAADVVARLVTRDGGEDPVIREDVLDRFLRAILSGNLRSFEEMKPELRRSRLGPDVFADVYIPEMARRLGLAWECDRLSFAEVTMGVARMQAILRDIGANWSADAQGPRVGPTLLLILPSGEQHTLGAMVLAGRLRRVGISVSLRIAPTASELSRLLAQRSFDGAMVSIASGGRLESCRAVVKALKESGKSALKVVVGGAIVDGTEEIVRNTGADLVTSDLSHALLALGIHIGQAALEELS